MQAASAIDSGDTETLRRLLDQGLHINQTFGRWKETLLHVAARENQLEVVKLLAGEYGADIHVGNKWGNDPIEDALEHGSYTAAGVLIGHSTRPELWGMDRKQVRTDWEHSCHSNFQSPLIC